MKKDSQLIIITSPLPLENENEHIISLFKEGLEILHLRKPDMAKEEYEQLLLSIPEEYHKRIMLHDFFELAEQYNVRGVHLNQRNPKYKGTKEIKISKSCHSMPELEMIDMYDYVFLSPIFDCISKNGYKSSFSNEELLEASLSGLINEKVIALGGIDEKTLPLLGSYNFGGIALLGAIWNSLPENYPKEENSKNIVQRFLKIKSLLKQLQKSPDNSLSCNTERKNDWMNSFPFQFITHYNDKYNYFQSAELALKGGCKWIQLRMKEASLEEIEVMALRIKPLCKEYNAIFLIDDHVEICKKVNADGVHLGKNDMNPAEARKILGNQFIIGGTCNTYDDILSIKDSVDYIGCGPFRFTTTKKNLSPTLGLDGYRNIVWNCRSNGINIPIVAIGGITVNDIADILQSGPNGIALSSTILNAEDPIKETEKIAKIIFP